VTRRRNEPANGLTRWKDRTAKLIYHDAKANVNQLTSATTKAGYPSAPKS
jgi:mercuric ion binding protein